jgi:tetratricopeptide (TPR) repeat protein
MRSIAPLLLIAVLALPVPAAARQGTTPAFDAQLQALLASEFAFQSGHFQQAFGYYQQKPLAELSPQERFRGGQMAQLLADSQWQQALMAQPAPVSATLEERVQRLVLAVRFERVDLAQSAWQALLIEYDEAGANEAGGLLMEQPETQRPFLLKVLQAYAARPNLSNFERLELVHMAQTWAQTDLAERLASSIAAGTPESAMLALFKACQLPKSEPCRQQLQQAEPSDFSELNRRRLVLLAQKTGDNDQQWRWWQALPQDGNTYYQRILILSNAMQSEKAKALMLQIQRDAQLSPFQRFALQGSLAELQADWPIAEASYRAALALDSPTSAAIRLPVVLLRQNKREAALQELQRVAGDPRYADEIRRDAVLIELQVLGNQQADRRDPAQLNAVYKRALALWPQAQTMRYQLAMRYFQQNKTEQAMTELKALLERAPANPDALNAYGFTLAKTLDKPRQAFEPLHKAYLLAPERPEILDSYGYVLHRLGRHEEALTPLQKAWQLTPSAVTAGHLARVYWQLGQRQEAQEYLRKGLQLDARETELLQLQEQWR